MKYPTDRETLETTLFVALPLLASACGLWLLQFHLWDTMPTHTLILVATWAAIPQWFFFSTMLRLGGAVATMIASVFPPVMGGLFLSALGHAHLDVAELCWVSGTIVMLMAPWAVAVICEIIALVGGKQSKQCEDRVRANFPGREVILRDLPTGYLVIDLQTKRICGRTDRDGKLVEQHQIGAPTSQNLP